MHPAHQPTFFAEPGALAPLFHARCGSNTRFAFGSTAGRYVLLVFTGSHSHGPSIDAIAKIKRSPAFNDEQASAFAVWADGQTGKTDLSKPRLPGLRHFDDPQGDIFALYRLGKRNGPSGQMRALPYAIAFDPMLRVLKAVTLDKIDEVIALIEQQARPVDHAGLDIQAPVLVVPRVFEDDFCDQLIAYYAAQGAQYSGVMSEKDGKTVYVENPSFKVRFDCQIEDKAVRTGARERVQRRLVPILHRALNFQATRMERYIVACYTKEKGGFFLPHRDNTTKGTAHRAFAVTINLNTGDYEGGGLRFPEFSDKVYVAPRGGAVVFGCCLLHEALPVTSGNRYAFLPFLYDDAGAKLREENSQFLSENVPNYTGSATRPADASAATSGE